MSDVFKKPPTRMVQGFLGLMLAVAACWPAATMAQSLSGRGLDVEVEGRLLSEEPPPGRDAGIVDPQGFLNRAPDVRERILRTMGRLQDDHGFRIILVIEPVFLDTNVFHQAAALQESWLPRGDGLVIVFESDSRRTGVSRAMAEANEGTDGIPPLVPAHVSMLIYQLVFQEIDPEQASPEMLEALVDGLAGRLTDHFTAVDPGDRSTRHLRVLLLLVGFGSLVGLLLLAARQLLQAYAPEVGTRRVFPDIDVPERLGAPYGGGHIACRSFGPGGQ